MYFPIMSTGERRARSSRAYAHESNMSQRQHMTPHRARSRHSRTLRASVLDLSHICLEYNSSTAPPPPPRSPRSSTWLRRARLSPQQAPETLPKAHHRAMTLLHTTRKECGRAARAQRDRTLPISPYLVIGIHRLDVPGDRFRDAIL